jgi:hypothetical protein
MNVAPATKKKLNERLFINCFISSSPTFRHPLQPLAIPNLFRDNNQLLRVMLKQVQHDSRSVSYLRPQSLCDSEDILVTAPA